MKENSERGQTATEYFIIASLVAGLTLLGFTTFHSDIKNTFLDFYRSAQAEIASR